MNPDCRDGKHAACSGTGWDPITDTPIPCPCVCHQPPLPDDHTTQQMINGMLSRLEQSRS